VDIYEYAGEMKSGFAAENLNTFFRNMRDATVQERLERQGRSGGGFETVH